MESSLLSNCLPKINQIWTHLSWAHQCHPFLNWKRNQKNLSWMTSNCLGRTHHGVFRKSMEHAFYATLYASCLFFPVHLSWKQKEMIALTTSSRFAQGHG